MEIRGTRRCVCSPSPCGTIVSCLYDGFQLVFQASYPGICAIELLNVPAYRQGRQVSDTCLPAGRQPRLNRNLSADSIIFVVNIFEYFFTQIVSILYFLGNSPSGKLSRIAGSGGVSKLIPCFFKMPLTTNPKNAR
jgi:hypothetical protein